jgi:acetolactate synthase-1/2/3 large subunit
MLRNYGSDVICKTLEHLGVECVFGIPGTQNVKLYDSLRRSSIRTVLTTHELAAAFMANGYFRSSGKVGVVVAIPGPGFTYALTGLAEAFLDSAAVICIVNSPASTLGYKFQLQAIDQKAIAQPIVKTTYRIDCAADISKYLFDAYQSAVTGEPGPVLVEVAPSVLHEIESSNSQRASPQILHNSQPQAKQIKEAIERIISSRRIILYLGQGANAASAQVLELAELLSSPVLTTTSARGILPENHYFAFPFSHFRGGGETINRMLEACDLVIALGCKFSHNGSGGFKLRIPAEKLIHVDASTEVLGANYPASQTILSDVSTFLNAILENRELISSNDIGWPSEELMEWRRRASSENKSNSPEPIIEGIEPVTPKEFFESLNEALPVNACLVTDSGLHQYLARRYFTVLSPRGLLVPTDFQAMGFGLPAGIGAKLASPERAVVVLMGDGGFAMSGMELLTAVREKVHITIILFNDGVLGLIRLQQMSNFGRSHAIRLHNPDFSKLAEAMGAAYFRMDGETKVVLQRCIAHPGVSLLEVRLKDSPAFRNMRAKALLRESARNLLGPERFNIVKKLMTSG